MNLTRIPMIQYMLSKTPLDIDSRRFREGVEKVSILNGQAIDSTNFKLLMGSDDFELNPLETWEVNLKRAMKQILEEEG